MHKRDGRDKDKKTKFKKKCQGLHFGALWVPCFIPFVV